ncbi:hypothetical protein BD122_35805 [Bradyrhizobium diazoefficiens]|uniref:hypothetical protein n=1 Tax=Bradyrhizobium diazoefficiens TaxID=1355477 RepID=UPI000481CA68|nr:hypothetical protein BD122_35805 [Bradyrhizobium diazoefficiens]
MTERRQEEAGQRSLLEAVDLDVLDRVSRIVREASQAETDPIGEVSTREIVRRRQASRDLERHQRAYPRFARDDPAGTVRARGFGGAPVVFRNPQPV